MEAKCEYAKAWHYDPCDKCDKCDMDKLRKEVDRTEKALKETIGEVDHSTDGDEDVVNFQGSY